ncbi:restriction endonuclease subunit S [Escherichia coli]|uniref:restriction endonuclease subunit S n=1 Tax=Escherichia coli TaxID=562 RepID=UPI00101F8D4C|nr:restriction endonuclease subunit S [Escherichia coli]EFH1082153.1 restriction endonuclease subunit S [Escherichia coli]EJD9518070.1 restriction endonuclease subunit S [Escherichia coli]MBA8263217.1 restriction endonuclease subunit S [Escherichia coli]MBA8283722.1 restriction endonuclease subunit S [Escherichia coli]MDY9504430.1 restriction endonuclease subunit S [Escherichia coli]
MSAGKLPEGWVECELSELGNIVTGKTPSTKEPSNFGGNIPFIKPGDLDLGGYIINTADTLTEKGLSLVPTLPANSVVVTCIGNLGKVGITAKKSASNQQINALIPSEKLNVKFVYYQILTLKPWLESQSAATTIAIVNKSKFSQAPFKFPPLAEQKIIAEKLDTLLAQVNSTKARLEQIPQILKRFRQAVLHVAVSGKLTEKWRLGNATLENSYEWKVQSLSDLGVLARGKSKHRPRNDPRLFGDKYPFIQTGEVANSSGRIKGASKFYSEFGLSQSKLFPKDTLCITIAANIADTAILEIEACFPDSVVGFISDKDKSHVSFVKYLIDVNKDNLEAFAPATAQKNINLKVLNELKLPIPDIKEQREIVRRVEQLFAYADTIEKQVNNALARVNNLTQSILAKAFRGELTTQWRAENPDLISGENSAAALLEKIKAERAPSGGKKASRKKS